MNQEDKLLWERIRAFQIDDPSSSFKFSDRLSRENDWDLEYALQAVLEYKKFIFLICVDPEPKTPSDQIDQVWHLHLLYTQSYWNEFCQNTLGKEIHHGPTKGVEQRGDFKSYYQATKESYFRYFKETPPEDFWPSEEERFRTVRFTRVNRDKYWIIPKIQRDKK